MKSFLESGKTVENLNLGYEIYNFILVDAVVRHKIKLSGEVKLYTEFPVRLLEQELRTQDIFCKTAIKMSETSCLILLFVKRGVSELTCQYQVQKLLNIMKNILNEHEIDALFLVSNQLKHYDDIPMIYQKQKNREPYVYTYDDQNYIYMDRCEEIQEDYDSYFWLKENVFQAEDKAESIRKMELLLAAGRQVFSQKQYVDELNFLAVQIIRMGEKIFLSDALGWKDESGQIFENLICAEHWIMKIYNSYLTEKEKSEQKSYSKMIRKSIEFMQKEYAKNLSSEDICDCLGISESHFRRLFKMETGVKPMEYLNKYRIDVAKQLLHSGNYRIQEVYEMVGFTSSQYFSTVFKKYTGISPGQYQQIEE